ncbi:MULTISPECIES: hypothetical protein [Methanocorpusculum]|jgi:hypothetical protein|uniref:Uncharacterized protein n=1 Tax=Methanocorpusculum parvum TaxID=2193 RepID=A0AAX0Q8U2_9EURY|nr:MULTISPECIES: hypothetical protein [Methanocorpusculum]MDD2248680.1 hypothetical protein [Methanocorpusculum sp.]MDD2802717.1 hypothetical protein [Methanocorpusculum sp.]MDD3047571.1 hypothetical protein [Methanocorpusculum sp.]MDD3912137.1 hypothetical protein [Methanocorpusculum sp.]MDD4423915.1 hypothetical protein [Methanocorpusculum parvum]
MSDTPSPAPKKRTVKPKLEKPTEPKPAKTSRKKASAEETVPQPEEQPNDTHKPVPEQFLTDLGSFADILETNPAILEPVREVFEYHLIDPIDRKTFPKLVNAMSMLLGANATMVLMTACHVNSAAFFDDLLYAIKDDKQKSAVWIIQHLTSLYGNRVQQAYTLSAGTMDEDWHMIDVNTYKREGDTPLWILNLELVLYNGTETKITMTPDSAFQLIEILSAELAKNIPKENVDEGLITKCEKNFTAFFEKFYGCKEEEKKTDEHPPGYA